MQISYLNLHDFYLTLDNMLCLTADADGNPPRRDALEMSNVGRLYIILLQPKLEILRVLPAAQGSRPLAEELGHTDMLYDGLGSAIFTFVQTVERQPLLTAEQKAAARRIRETFIPSLGDLQKSYATEAAQAKRNKASLETRAEDLKLFVVPGPQGNQTLYDWAEAFLAQGERLEMLLNQRATIAMSDPNAGQGSALRTELISMMGVFRSALAQEIAGRPELPRNLEGLVFGFMDDLCRTRELAAKRSKGSEGQAEKEAEEEPEEEEAEEAEEAKEPVEAPSA